MENKHLQLLQLTFESERNTEKATGIEKYMWDMFLFIGLRAPDRKLLSEHMCEKAKVLGGWKYYINHTFIMGEVWHESYSNKNKIERTIDWLFGDPCLFSSIIHCECSNYVVRF